MKNRFLSVLLAIVLCLGALVFPANASAVSGQTTLAGADLQIYNQLKEGIAEVANGARDSAVFEFDTTDMGISYINGALRGIDTSAIVRALSVDCPYELYWFDKTTGFSVSGRGSHRDGAVTSMTFQFAVSQDYAVTNAAGTTYSLYQTDPAKISAAAAVMQNAQALVARSSTLSDYEKLTAYRDYICEQVSYNRAAADNSNYPYGGPWQLIYVFDDDPNTNVVCEGYAKAFKYLCDLTTFSNRVECCIVSGYTSGSHMWNIVRINGQSYLADVTSSDTGSAGEYGGLFLAGAAGATGNGCTIDIPRHDLGGGYYVQARSIKYTYDTDTKALYDSGILTLAPSDYSAGDSTPVDSSPVDGAPADSAPADSAPVDTAPVDGAPVDTAPVDTAPVDTAPVDTAPVDSAPPSFTDVPAGAWYADAVGWAVAHEITNGTGDGLFSPGQDCTHAHILTFLWRAAGKPEAGVKTPVANVNEDDYFYQAVLWASDMGMIDPGTFDPGKLCTRSQAALYICQAFAVPYQSPVDSGFSDVSADVPYAYAVDWAVENGVTDGTGNGQFSPDRVCDRGTIVTFLHRAYVPEARLK